MCSSKNLAQFCNNHLLLSATASDAFGHACSSIVTVLANYKLVSFLTFTKMLTFFVNILVAFQRILFNETFAIF